MFCILYVMQSINPIFFSPWNFSSPFLRYLYCFDFIFNFKIPFFQIHFWLFLARRGNVVFKAEHSTQHKRSWVWIWRDLSVSAIHLDQKTWYWTEMRQSTVASIVILQMGGEILRNCLLIKFSSMVLIYKLTKTNVPYKNQKRLIDIDFFVLTTTTTITQNII